MENKKASLKDNVLGILIGMGIVAVFGFILYTILKGFMEITYTHILEAGFGLLLFFILFTQSDK